MGNKLPIHYVMKLMNSPDVLARGVRQVVRKRTAELFDYRRTDGFSKPPAQLGFKLVNACNLRCKMCGQWGETGYNFSRPAAELKEIVPLETYQRLLDEVAPFKPWIFVWGGEPFLYPDVMPLLTYMKQKGLTISVSTNGTKMDKHIEKLVEIGTDFLLISIDGPQDTHDDIRGYKGAFEITARAMQAIQAEKKRQGKTKPYIFVVSVITANNQNNLVELYEVAEQLDADLMMMFYSWFQTRESGQRQTALLEERLGITPWSWAGWMWNVDAIDPQAVARSVAEVNARKWRFPHTFYPNLKLEDIPAYYRDHSQTFGYDKCVAPWLLGEIMPNGDVVTCRDYPDVVLGNICQESLLDIWNNQRARSFRQLLQEGLMPICARCEGMMGP